MKRSHAAILGALWLWMLAGCGLYDRGRELLAVLPEENELGAATSADFVASSGTPEAMIAEVGRSAKMMAQRVSTMVPEAAAEPGEMPLPADAQRLVIKTAGLELEIGKYELWMGQVQTLVKEVDGFIVSASTHQAYENVKRGELSIRVPQSRFEELLERLKASAVRVEGERVGGQDVTEEFFDLEARLGNQRRTEQRFQEILRSAKTVEEILDVERELSRVREQIELLEGRRRYLKDRIELSTVSVEWHEPYPLGGGVEGQSFWTKIAAGFERGLEVFTAVLQGLIIFVIAALPVVVFLGVLGWIAARFVRWRRSRTLL